ncbi:Uu.00g127720.m01.CDS01 [Anthostomella pinea]|uniref:Cross-pathway control protein 1 n=1 Tax=Anthostomella pinea TaxID=933095 RepID=A0AAI8VI44_9PEZI|nr:Uu.00g127720.m01.CDS01 [Anthostomella pinea]
MASLQFIEPAGIIRATAQLPAPAAAGLLAAASFGSLNNTRRNSSHQVHDSSTSPAALQNQRVQQIIQAQGRQISPSAYTNRLNSPAQTQHQQFYASFSAPSSTAAVNQQNRSARPPVPLFAQGIGGQQTAGKMDLQGKSFGSDSDEHLNSHKSDALRNIEDFTPFGGGASTSAYSSPGLGNYDANISSASSSIANMATISPQDLFLREPFASAPNSSALTTLTTPSTYGESPDFDNYEVSPNYNGGDFEGDTGAWYSLFPESTSTEHPQVADDDKSPGELEEELEVIETTSQRRRKSGNSPPTGGHGRHSSVSGVNSRRRDKPLPPIVVDDPQDTVAMKRARNTLAARKSRERKAQKMEELEEEIVKLTEDRDHWKRIALSRTGASS